MADSSPTTTAERAADGQSRPAVIIAALLYLITAYQRTPCPCVALCIVRHLECLAGHERPIRSSGRSATRSAKPGRRLRWAVRRSPLH